VNPDSISEWLRWGVERLKSAGIDSAYLDAVLLMVHASGGQLNKTDVMIARAETLPAESLGAYRELISRRAHHEPLAYITGHCEFMGLNFTVTPAVLIPRPDTEILTEAAIRLIRAQGQVSALDLCTGSGCVAISLAHYCPELAVTATDISEAALAVARQNAAALLPAPPTHSIRLLHADLFEGLPAGSTYGLITANPPYIPTSELDGLQASVKDYEPFTALDGGEDGLIFYRRIAQSASDYLVPEGYIIMEIGYDQAENVKQLLETNHFTEITIERDLAGLDRVAIARRG
jgi:release factor glutamine methyltransferase